MIRPFPKAEQRTASKGREKEKQKTQHYFVADIMDMDDKGEFEVRYLKRIGTSKTFV
jgi:hypothetical protein